MATNQNYMTDAELKELGITRRLWDEWYTLMCAIHNSFSKLYPNVKSLNNCVVVKEWTIGAHFVNDSFIQVFAKERDVTILELRFTNNYILVIRVLYELIK